eukprot:12935638-Prorocentrum_lima.AAC.1
MLQHLSPSQQKRVSEFMAGTCLNLSWPDQSLGCHIPMLPKVLLPNSLSQFRPVAGTTASRKWLGYVVHAVLRNRI